MKNLKEELEKETYCTGGSIISIEDALKVFSKHVEHLKKELLKEVFIIEVDGVDKAGMIDVKKTIEKIDEEFGL